MRNRIVKHFLNESQKLSNYRKLEQEDMDYLGSIANYMFSKKAKNKEGIAEFHREYASSARGSDLCQLLTEESKAKLKHITEIYCLTSSKEITEEENEGECFHSSPFISGSIDSGLMRKFNESSGFGESAIASFPFDPNNTFLYVPMVSNWLSQYIADNKETVDVKNFLRSAKNALSEFNWQKEIICKHDPKTPGKFLTEL